jgi:hypothetical protein
VFNIAIMRLPTLPLELWLLILENAAGETADDMSTDLPDMLLVPPGAIVDVSGSFEPSFNKCQQKEYQRGVHNKCSWALVS